ncbi:MAG: MFS transporter [Planctomycetes bacterium]|nr:MFS transporter [Planctomycetota bacterium]
MNQTGPTESKRSLLRTFPATFWLANVFELFERGAYYGLNSLLGIYLTNKTGGALGFDEDESGLLQGMVYAATYVVPILGGALADRYGYRRMLLVAFSLLSAGYFLSGQVTAYWVFFATLLVMATGSGLFKPIITGTIARVTDEKTSGFGFGIYYWMINLGALIAPLVAGFLRGFSWSYVFFASSLYCALMLLLTIFAYREPPRPESSKTVRQVLAGAVTVLSDARFMLLIFVYSCFWILYFQNFGAVLWYLRDFIDPAPVNALFARLGIPFSFDAEHVTAINAGTIVLLQIVVSRTVKNLKALPTMVGGILIGSTGFLLLSSSQYAWVFVLGIVVFSIGEMTCHPKYYSYIGLIAPEDQKAVYMGYAFLYGVVGSLVGANLGGELYTALLKPLVGAENVAGELRSFWLVFVLIGAATAVLLFVYHKLFGRDTPATRARARKVMFAVYGLLLCAAAGVVYHVFSATGAVPVKTGIQAGIMVVVGAGGLAVLARAARPRKL